MPPSIPILYRHVYRRPDEVARDKVAYFISHNSILEGIVNSNKGASQKRPSEDAVLQEMQAISSKRLRRE